MPLIIEQKTNFALPMVPNRFSARLSSRRPDTAKLEKEFCGIITRLPQVAIRGCCSKSSPGTDSYLISSVPIAGLLSAQDISPSNFLARLYLTVSSAFNHAANHAWLVGTAKKLTLSFYFANPTGGPITEAAPFKLSPGFFRDCAADPGLPIREVKATFPHYCLNLPLDVLLAELKYDSRSYRASLEDAASKKLDALFFARRDAIAYRDTLKLLLFLFKKS